MVYIAFYDVQDACRGNAKAPGSAVELSSLRKASDHALLFRLPILYQRRTTREVVVGDPARGGVIIGGDHPVVVQSMLTCDTMDTAASSSKRSNWSRSAARSCASRRRP